MPIIPVNFDDAQEAKPAKPGRYNLQITEAKLAETGPNSKRPGSPQFRVSIGFPGEENVPNMTQFISLPHEDDEKGSANYKTLLLKRFLVLFGVPFNPKEIDTERMAMEMVGCTATAEVGLTEPNEKGDVFNTLVVPRLRDEPEGTRRR